MQWNLWRHLSSVSFENHRTDPIEIDSSHAGVVQRQECRKPKLDVEGLNPFARSMKTVENPSNKPNPLFPASP